MYVRRKHRFGLCFFFFQAEDGIRDLTVTGVQTCALPICFPLSAVFVSLSRSVRSLFGPAMKTMKYGLHYKRIRGDGPNCQFGPVIPGTYPRSEEHTSELQSQSNLVCRLLLEKKKKKDTSE